MYVRHKGTIEDHKEWEKHKANWKAKTLKGKKDTDNSNSRKTKKIIVMDTLKNALVSDANGWTDEMSDKFCQLLESKDQAPK